MKVTATKLANDYKAVAKIQRKAGASRKEMAELLKSIKFSKSETKELKKAMDAASDVFGYAGRH